MHSAAASFTLVLAGFAASVNGLGCYSSSLTFKGLHGGDNDIISEVLGDISSTCQQAAGKDITSDTPYWRCSEWQTTQPSNPSCYEDCESGCKAMGTGPAAELAKGACLAGCDPNCVQMPSGNDYNHIDWAIEASHGQSGGTITYDLCNAAFGTEVSGCASGSEQNHDNFWFRIDPNSGRCS